MNEQSPLIRFIGYEDGELAPLGEEPLKRYGTVPSVGDVILDPISVDLLGPVVVTRRFFAPVTGEQDVWYLMIEHQSQDAEGMAIHRHHLELEAIHADIRAEHKAAHPPAT